MRILYQIISWISLVGTLLPSMLYCAGMMSLDMVKWIMLISTLIWFAITPLWMERKQTE